MSAIELTEDLIIAAEKGDQKALASVVDYFENDIQIQCLACENPKIAEEKRQFIINRLIEDIKQEWPGIHVAMQKAFEIN